MKILKTLVNVEFAIILCYGDINVRYRGSEIGVSMLN